MSDDFMSATDLLLYLAGALPMWYAIRRIDQAFGVPPPPPMPRKLPSGDVFELGYGEWAGRRLQVFVRMWPIHLFFGLLLLLRSRVGPAPLSGAYLLGALACAAACLGLHTLYRWLRRLVSGGRRDQR